MSLNFKTRRAIKVRAKLLRDYPNLLDQVALAGRVELRFFLPEGFNTETSSCSGLLSTAIDAAITLFMFKPALRVHINEGTYKITSPVRMGATRLLPVRI